MTALEGTVVVDRRDPSGWSKRNKTGHKTELKPGSHVTSHHQGLLGRAAAIYRQARHK